MKLLTRIQQKPAHVRTQYALIISLGITAVVVLVWVTTLPARFAQITSGVPTEETQEAVTGLDAILSANSEQMAAVIDAAKAESPEGVREEPTAESSSDTSELGALDVHEATSTQAEIVPENAESAEPVPPERESSSQEPRVILISTTTASRGE